MAAPSPPVTRPPLKPAPTQQQADTADPADVADEAEARELAQFCFEQSRATAETPSGPKWMAEGLKAQRLARAIHDKLADKQKLADMIEHERLMAGLGRRGN